MTHSFDFAVCDTELFCMLSEHVKPNVGCFRCKSIFHFVNDCPFQEKHAPLETVKKEKENTTRGSRGQRQRDNTGTSWNVHAPVFSPNRQSTGNTPQQRQPCFNFNAGICRFTNNTCSRRHVCSKCGGSEPLPCCASCNASGTVMPHVPK